MTIFKYYLLIPFVIITIIFICYVIYYQKHKEELNKQFLSINNFSKYIDLKRLILDFIVLLYFAGLIILLIASFSGVNIFGLESNSEGIRQKNNILYYVGFYFLIFVIQIFKIIKEGKEGETWIGQWRDFFDITLDLAFSWSGVIIALLTNFEKQWHSTIFISSIIIFIISIFTSVYQKRLRKLSFSLNIFIISFVLTSTYYVYAFKLPNIASDTSGNPLNEPSNLKEEHIGCKVILPYKDPSLSVWLNNSQLDETLFYYEYTSLSNNIDTAKTEAINSFNKDSIVCLYNPNPKRENKYKIKLKKEKIEIIRLLKYDYK